ncbi:MAG: chemotaxis protein CheW [Verrucomicrobiota bacterium]
MQQLVSTNAPPKLELGISAGLQVFACPKEFIGAVIMVDAIQQVPASPDYVLGATPIDEQMYTLVDLEKLSGGAAKGATSSTSDSSVGLVVSHPDCYPIILVGQSAVSLDDNSTCIWKSFKLPAAFNKHGTEELEFTFVKAN